jgi:hypothetical protein
LLAVRVRGRNQGRRLGLYGDHYRWRICRQRDGNRHYQDRPIRGRRANFCMVSRCHREDPCTEGACKTLTGPLYLDLHLLPAARALHDMGHLPSPLQITPCAMDAKPISLGSSLLTNHYRLIDSILPSRGTGSSCTSKWAVAFRTDVVRQALHTNQGVYSLTGANTTNFERFSRFSFTSIASSVTVYLAFPADSHGLR